MYTTHTRPVSSSGSWGVAQSSRRGSQDVLLVINSVPTSPTPVPLLATTVATNLLVVRTVLRAAPTTVGAATPVTAAAMTNLVVAALLDQAARLGWIPALLVAAVEVAQAGVVAEAVAEARPRRLPLLLPLRPM